MKAHFRCLKCKHRWDGIPGPYNKSGQPNVCPKCGSKHFDWLNWEEVTRKVRKQSFDEKNRRWIRS